MANERDNENVKVNNAPKKADVILKIERDISVKQEEMNEQQKRTADQIENALNEIAQARQEINERSEGEFNALKRELQFLALQNENIFNQLADKISELSSVVDELKSAAPQEPTTTEIDYELLADKVAARIPVPVNDGEETVYAAPVATSTEIDYDVLAERIARYLPAQETVAADAYEQPEFDYDTLADMVASRITVPASSSEQAVAVAPVATSVDIDYDFLADKVVSRIPVYDVLSPDYVAAKVAEQLGATPLVQAGDASVAEIDYDYLSDKVAEKLNVSEVQGAEVDYEYLSDRVAEKLNVPEAQSPEIDYDYLAEKVAEKVGESGEKSQPVYGEIDYEYLANSVAEKIEIPAIVDYDDFCEKVAGSIVVPQGDAAATEVAVASVPAEVKIDEDELADKIALKVGSLKAENFDILVDDEGCNAISKEIIDKLDYDLIANTVAERLRDTFDLSSVNEPDYDEMAYRISEKITVAGVNEDAIADKAAQALSNYLPEIDTDEIADKVASQVISALPAVDNDIICAGISERIIESQADHDYDIVLDEDGINNITASVTEKVKGLNDNRFDEVDKELAEIKEMLENGAVVREAAYTGSEAYEVVDDDIVTVSEIVEQAEAESEEVVEEQPEEVAEEPVEEITEEEVIEEPDEAIVEEEAAEEVPPLEEPAEYFEEENVEVVEEPAQQIVEESESPAEEVEDEDDDDDDDDDDGEIEEFSYDDLAGGKGGVDFLNMMRYNRSFIARIIQGSDAQKSYYGEVRTALLSYKKVNSNIAWGAERFHKGRETIARFKIRGKTLCLYLALDPKEYPYSVYYQKDVSNVRMFDGTPMMVKIKSPLYVRKAIRLIDEMLAKRGGEKREIPQRDYAAMYPYETIEELMEDGLVKEPKRK